MQEQNQNLGCFSQLRSCWAAFFCHTEHDEKETIRLVHPAASANPEVKEMLELGEPMDSAKTGEAMWTHYVNNQFDFTKVDEYPNYVKSPFLVTCYKFLVIAANDGCKTSMGYLNQIPGPLRLLLDKQLNNETAYAASSII